MAPWRPTAPAPPPAATRSGTCRARWRPSPSYTGPKSSDAIRPELRLGERLGAHVFLDEPGPRALLLEALGADVEPRRGRRRWPLAAPFAAGSLLIDPPLDRVLLALGARHVASILAQRERRQEGDVAA